MTAHKVKKKFDLQLFAGVSLEQRRLNIDTMTTELRSLIEGGKVEEAKAKKDELKREKELYEMEKELQDDEQRQLENQKEPNQTRSNENKEQIEYRAITKTLRGEQLTEEERASVNVGNSGAIMPQGFISTVEVERKGFPSLKKYCHVIPVKTNTGKMPISKGVTNRKLAKLNTDTEMVKEMITTEPVEFAVEDYGKIIPVENSVLEDAGVDFYNGVLAPEYAECEVNTENLDIVSIVIANATAVAGTDYKAIQKAINSVVPSLKAGLVIITNQTGFDHLDGLTDTTGRPLLSDSLAVEGGKTFKGKEIITLEDADLEPVTTGKKPYYIANLKALVKFFERKGVEIAQSKEAGFTLNQTFIRMVKRFDTVKGDTRACKYVEF